MTYNVFGGTLNPTLLLWAPCICRTDDLFSGEISHESVVTSSYYLLAYFAFIMYEQFLQG